MKSCILPFAVLCVASTAFGWIHPQPNYQKQFDDADFVGVVRISKVAESGDGEVVVENPKIMFRKVVVTLEVILAFKGESPNAINLSLLRFPTEQECIGDLGQEAGRRAIMLLRLPGREGFLVPTLWGDYLVFLTKQSDDSYLPTGGFHSASHSLLEIKAPLASISEQARKSREKPE